MKPPIPVLALAAAVALLAGCGGDTPPDEAAKSASASASDDHHDHGGGDPDAPPQPTSVTLGAPVSLSGKADGEEFEVTYAVTKIDTADKADDGGKPGSGKVFVVADVEVHSYKGSHTVGPGNDDYVFSLIDKKDKEYRQSKQEVGEPLTGTVKSKKTRSGTVVFEVPESIAADGKIRLKAKGANSGDQTIIWKRS
ncbi:DUF4352 domain-containing protein [Stackebrandtia nassauensis]|uniref:DUF4352 domain-containing protein n=1 Tax=Stackebrandtia nassauensis (strain DSM 44728 / CIP 108903 / NRRL B-16338 / NBRC 102104 / LLR-40K-21) TaxID=446470 RepID=D3PYR5_STANL|nr:DUF4352 domain-containing protein [Stackebrandtia nassauensis]ADD43498.1 hypothetical protein Snas_3842 [Stackebrandtia nassauensis DSM 44728]